MQECTLGRQLAAHMQQRRHGLELDAHVGLASAREMVREIEVLLVDRCDGMNVLVEAAAEECLDLCEVPILLAIELE